MTFRVNGNRIGNGVGMGTGMGILAQELAGMAMEKLYLHTSTRSAILPFLYKWKFSISILLILISDKLGIKINPNYI